jgi:predicted SpoU family rRNA methylase
LGRELSDEIDEHIQSDLECMWLIVEYLDFCVSQKTFNNDRLNKLIKKFNKNNDEHTIEQLGRMVKGKGGFFCWNHDISVKSHIRQLRFHRVIDRYGHSSFDWSDRVKLNKVEDEIRLEFGLPKIGESWITETSIYNLVVQQLSDKGVDVLHHYRPKFLEGKELDIYFEFKDKKVGIEYQGKQHFQPIDFFGGEEGFKDLQRRDKEKKKLCVENGVELIYINHYEDVSKELVLKKLSEVEI